MCISLPEPERDALDDGPPPMLRILRYESSLNIKIDRKITELKLSCNIPLTLNKYMINIGFVFLKLPWGW